MPSGRTFGDAMAEEMGKRKRGFEVFFNGKKTASVITRGDDEFTSALADRFATILARWWNGKVEWPT
jgi:hypothetical protein